MKAPPPCPFCGKSAAIDTLNYTIGKPGKFRVQCQNCFAATQWKDNAEQAWEAWAIRAKAPAAAPARQGKPPPVNAVIGADMFILGNVIHTRNPHTGFCYSGNNDVFKRMKKADFVKAYSECVKKCSEELKTATEAKA